jgi:hypothetical protein
MAAIRLPVLLLVLAASATAFADSKLSGRVTDLNDQPISGATVFVNGRNGLETMVTTDPTGRYVATVHVPGVYSVVAQFGRTQNDSRIDVPPDGTATLNMTLPVGSEVIEIHEYPRPVQDAKPKQDPLAIPPYSDEAILGDYWAKAWLLLDVDERGVIARVKFLKRPGFGLDEIAVKYAFDMRFDPARDEHGRPTRTYIVWPLEWPSHDWLAERFGITTRLPTFLDSFQTDHGVATSTFPPCEGGRPLNFNAIHPALRDCSEPDLSTADAIEPWLVRDGTIPPPVVPPAPRLDPAEVRREQLAAARGFRASAIVSSVISVGMLVGAGVSYTQWHKYGDRAMGAPAPFQRNAEQSRANRWEIGTTAFITGAVVTAMTSAYFWSQSTAHLALQAAPEGGAIAYAGSF